MSGTRFLVEISATDFSLELFMTNFLQIFPAWNWCTDSVAYHDKWGCHRDFYHPKWWFIGGICSKALKYSHPSFHIPPRSKRWNHMKPHIWDHRMGLFHIRKMRTIHKYTVLLVEIEGPGAGIPSVIIYLLLKGFLQSPLFINQPMGKGHLWW